VALKDRVREYRGAFRKKKNSENRRTHFVTEESSPIEDFLASLYASLLALCPSQDWVRRRRGKEVGRTRTARRV
jgi:hypothetical protein